MQAICQAGLRPGSQSWLQGLNVRISSANADSFTTWFRTHDTPGPYHQMFVIDGHRTHYLAFGATWLHKNGRWVPAHTALDDAQAQRTSIYAWSLWAAAQDKLPPLVCGTSGYRQPSCKTRSSARPAIPGDHDRWLLRQVG